MVEQAFPVGHKNSIVRPDSATRAERLGCAASGGLLLSSEAGFDEAFEEGMRAIGLALKFRMILTGEEPRMIAQFNQLGQGAIGRSA